MKIHDWNAKLAENDEVEVSFKITDLNTPKNFVNIFQAGKDILESSDSSDDYVLALTSFVLLMRRAIRQAR